MSKPKSKDYLKGFKHGIAWALLTATLDFKLFKTQKKISEDQCELLEDSLDKIFLDGKDAIKSLKAGR
jgi:hypothetical protein